MDPSQRLTCEMLLNHAYFDRYELYTDTKKPMRASQRVSWAHVLGAGFIYFIQVVLPSVLFRGLIEPLTVR